MLNKLFGAGNRRWLVIFPLLGLLLLVILVKLKPAPKIKPQIQVAPLVKVEVAKMRNLQAVISGFGRAKSKETWQAVAEVSGTVVYRHADLEKGAMLPAGTVALKIDPVDYQLKLAQAKSDLNSAKADADRIALNKNKMTLSLELEQNRLQILQKELKRKQGLVKKGSISRSLVDQEQSNVFAQQQKVLDLQTNLKLIPNDIEVAKAKIQVNESRVKEAQRKLDKTQIVIPFDARITAVNAEVEQVINQQAVLIKANHIGAMQVSAQFSLADMKSLIRQSLPSEFKSNQSFPDIRQLQLAADINMWAGDSKQQWQGTVTRVGDSIDAQGNTVSLVVETSNQWQNFDPINKPPLMNDMFVQVNVKAKANQLLSVPAVAVHGERIYVIDDDVLRVKPVRVLFEANDYVAVDANLADTVVVGDRVIVTDLLPAVDGMLVRAAIEKAAIDKVKAE
jgi:hypothetical protein